MYSTKALGSKKRRLFLVSFGVGAIQKLNGNLLKNCGGGNVEVCVHVLIYNTKKR